MRLVGPFTTPAAAGGAGAGAATFTTPTRLCGRFEGVYIDYTGVAAPATTDVVVKTLGTAEAGPTITFLTLTNKNTDGWFFPRKLMHDLVGVALAALTIAEPIPFDDYIVVTIAEADDGTTVKFWILLSD